MSVINDLKKLLFGAKSFAKSAAEKAKESSQEALDKMEDIGADVLNKAKEVAADIGGKTTDAAELAGKKIHEFIGGDDTEAPETDEIMDDILKEDASTPPSVREDSLELPPLSTPEKTTSSTPQSPSPPAEDARSLTDKAGNLAEKVGEQVLDAGEKLTEKAGRAAEELGSKALAKGSEALEKAKELAEDLGAKLRSARDELMKKAEEEAANSGEASKDLSERIAKLNRRIEDAISGNNTKFADKPLDLGGSELDKHDSFWDKAAKFAEGDYAAVKPTSPRISKDSPENSPGKGSVKGFKDLDGDGDEIIDDAIIDDDK